MKTQKTVQNFSHIHVQINALCILLLIVFPPITTIQSQTIEFCGVFPPHQATSNNPDSIYWDRFGNSYDMYSDLSIGSNLNSGCQDGSGYYILDFGNGITSDMKDVFCQVFSDLSDSIHQRINIDGCGDTLQPDKIRIGISIKPLAQDVLMAASPIFSFSLNNNCDPLGVSHVERKINGSRNYSPFVTDGYIYINTGIQGMFYTNLTDNQPNPGSKYDAYSVILHEALHLLGYASLMWLVHPDSLQGFSTWDKNLYTTNYYGTSSQVTPVIESDCQHNCWELNSTLFPDEEDLFDAIVNNCSIGGDLDFIFGASILAPLSGRDDNDPPTLNGELSNLLSHLHGNCNGNTSNYIMQPSIDTGEVRRYITNEELAILCTLGFKLNDCEGCYVIPYVDTESTMNDIDACCETYFTACKNTPKEILFTELLCNDFSNEEITVTDVFPISGNYEITDTSIIITSAATGRIQFGYTIKGCDCTMQNAHVNVYIGVCNNCNETDPCENLTCVNGFDGWDQGTGQFALHENLAGVLWYSNLNNSVDVCKVATNSFVHIGSTLGNKEGLAIQLSESVLPGCTAIVSYKASVKTKNVFKWHASEFAPCRFDDTRVGVDCTLTQCESHEYSPQCIYSDTITNIAENITQLNNLCPLQPNLDSTYTFKWKNGFDFPINYLILFPEPNPLGINNYIDDIIVTQSCLNPAFTFSFQEDCQEVDFNPIQMDSIYFHSWIFSDGDTSLDNSPTHAFQSIDTFRVQHFISDTCGNIDSFELDVIIPEESTLCCPDTTLSVGTTWNLTTVLPGDGRFHTITLEQGVSLSIEDGLVLEFCEGGALVIEAGAYFSLDGTLTSYGDMSWLGVFVEGDTAQGQHKDYSSGGFHGNQQGSLHTREGSMIKNAKIGIRNYGLAGDGSTGGKIRCDATSFINNTIGVDFGPYQNYNTEGQPVPSLGTFNNCTFNTDSTYHLHEPFHAFVKMRKADGMRFAGCSFTNELLPELPSQVSEFGFGIHAVSSGFMVYAGNSTAATPICPHPCVVGDSTTFNGLGHGIYVLTQDKTQPYSVYHAQFENCFRGITSMGTTGGTILSNTFKLGHVPDYHFSYGQIGAEFHFPHEGFTLQENLFVSDEDPESIPIGVLCNDLGEFDNEIRRNTFIGIETANQAFGVNADLTLDIERGLVYFCNSIDETPSHGYDFHIPNAPNDDYIHPFQTPGSSQGSNISAGNHFAYTAQDFMNLGEGDINYWYYPLGDNEEPRDSFSLNISDFEGDSNACEVMYCAPSCIEVIGDLKEDFINHLDDYGVNLDNYINILASANQPRIDSTRSKALYYRRLSSRDAYTVVQHLMIDTLDYHRDSLITWMGHLDTYGAEAMIAGEYAAAGDFESALDVLETISARRDLSAAQSLDLDKLLDIYYLLELMPLQSFTPQDRSLLRNIAYANTGAASGISRALLSYFGEYIPLPYYHGEQINFRNVAQDSSHTFFSRTNDIPLKIYPNPTDGNVMIEWDDQELNCVSLGVFNIYGEEIIGLKGDLKSPFSLDTNPCTNGIYCIIARDNNGKTISGKFIMQRN